MELIQLVKVWLFKLSCLHATNNGFVQLSHASLFLYLTTERLSTRLPHPSLINLGPLLDIPATLGLDRVEEMRCSLVEEMAPVQLESGAE